MDGQHKTRSSKQRRVILETLQGVTSHPTADELFAMVREKLPQVSLGTVYRNLEMLSETGQIQKLELAGVQRHYDGEASPHLHIRCAECDRVADVHDVDGPNLDSVFPKTTGNGFHVTGYRLELSGLCPHCRPD